MIQPRPEPGDPVATASRFGSGKKSSSVTKTQLITAVIPAFNAEAFLVESVSSVLGQTYQPIECIVVNDGSADATRDVAAEFGDHVRLISQQHLGVAVARNRGAREASGDLLAFLDADDTWLPERVERQFEVMQRRGADAVLCASSVAGSDAPMSDIIRLRPTKPTLESLLSWCGTVVSTSSNLLIRTRRFHDVGGFDETLSTAADWELLTRLLGLRLVYLDEPLVRYRWRGGNMTRDVTWTERDLRRAYSLVLEREGAALTISQRCAYGGFHRMLASANLRLGHYRRGLAHAISAAWCDPRGTVRMLAGRRTAADDASHPRDSVDE
jgi:glycosyltransferase involved in cell wall biosynthesis